MKQLLFSEQDILDIENKIGYTFNNKLLLQQAFICRSYNNDNPNYQNSEVLEFIGDTVLDYIVVKNFVKLTNFTGGEYISPFDEGELTKIKINLVKGSTLAKAMDDLGLNKYLILSKLDCENGLKDAQNLKENLVEALIASVAIDSNFNIEKVSFCVETMLNLTEKLSKKFNDENRKLKQILQKLGDYNIDNAYNKLEELYVAKLIEKPQYITKMDNDKKGKICWRSTCYLMGKTTSAIASKENEAKRLSAYHMILEILNM